MVFKLFCITLFGIVRLATFIKLLNNMINITKIKNVLVRVVTTSTVFLNQRIIP